MALKALAPDPDRTNIRSGGLPDKHVSTASRRGQPGARLADPIGAEAAGDHGANGAPLSV